MKTDDLTPMHPTHPRQDALPELSTIESALTNEDNEAIKIANQAVSEWNGARKSEVAANKAIMDDDVQSAMATEVFDAFITYLKTIPRGVQEKVIARFHDINLPDGHKRVITL